jgi:hypothetical protein
MDLQRHVRAAAVAAAAAVGGERPGPELRELAAAGATGLVLRAVAARGQPPAAQAGAG